MDKRFVNVSFEEKRTAIADKILQVLVEESLTIAEAESILFEIKERLKLTPVTFS